MKFGRALSKCVSISIIKALIPRTLADWILEYIET
jgi:hypothetical protein